MPSRLNEFTRFMNDFGPRAFDQLAVGRLGASIAAAAEGIPADVTPLDGLAAHWSTLSADEKTRFFKKLLAGAPSKPRAKARSRTAAKVTSAAEKPKRAETKTARDPDKKKAKKAKKEAKAKAKEAKKLRKKEAKAKAKAEKKAKKLAKAAEKKAKNAQLAPTQ
ncbi:MAG TPA: hypothetical protein VGF40_04880 [Thermoanaerobaculia bacterium]